MFIPKVRMSHSCYSIAFDKAIYLGKSGASEKMFMVLGLLDHGDGEVVEHMRLDYYIGKRRKTFEPYPAKNNGKRFIEVGRTDIRSYIFEMQSYPPEYAFILHCVRHKKEIFRALEKYNLKLHYDERWEEAYCEK